MEDKLTAPAPEASGQEELYIGEEESFSKRWTGTISSQCQSRQVHRISPTAACLPDESDFGSLRKDGEKTSLSDYSFSTIRPV